MKVVVYAFSVLFVLRLSNQNAQATYSLNCRRFDMKVDRDTLLIRILNGIVTRQYTSAKNVKDDGNRGR